jgi:hypothetical protein
MRYKDDNLMGIFSKRRKPQDDELLLQALGFVIAGEKAKDFQWISLGVSGYSHWLKSTGTLSPEKDFQFIQEYVPIFWDMYRLKALSAKDAPKLSTDEVKTLIADMQRVVATFPKEFSGESTEIKELLLYMCSCLTALEETGNIELSNAAIHALLFLWAHSRVK